MYPGFHAAQLARQARGRHGRDGPRVTYAELDERSAHLAQLLHARGLRLATNFALLAENHPRYFEVFWAALRSGLYLTAVNRHLNADEAAYLVNDSGAKAFITTRRNGIDRGRDARSHPRLPQLRCMMDGTAAGLRVLRGRHRRPASRAARPTSRAAMSCCTRRARPAGPRASCDRLTGKQIDDPDAIGMGIHGAVPARRRRRHRSTCARHRSTTPPACSGRPVCTRSVGPSWSWRVRRRAVPRPHRAGTSHPHPGRAHHARPHHEAARRSPRLRYDVSSLQCVVHAAAPCPLEVKRQVIDWLGPIVSEYYAATEGTA